MPSLHTFPRTHGDAATRNIISWVAATFFVVVCLPVPVTASPPLPFDSLSLSLTSPSSITVVVGRPTVDLDFAELSLVTAVGCDVVADSLFVLHDFPAHTTFTFRSALVEGNAVRVKIVPVVHGKRLPPVYRSVRITSSGNGRALERIPYADFRSLVAQQKRGTPPLIEDSAFVRGTLKQDARPVDSAPPEAPRHPIDSAEDLKKPQSPLGTISVSGRWLYYDELSQLQPIKYARVELYDHDLLGDVPLATSFTDIQGNYEFSGINNDDGLFQGGLDIFTEIHCDYWRTGETDKNVKVTNGYLGSTFGIAYWAPTSRIDDVADGPHSLGSFAVTGDSRASWGFYHHALQAYEFYKNSSPSFRTDKVAIYWPYGDWPGFMGMPWLGLAYHIEIPQDWEWLPLTTIHEYSHAAMFKMYGNGMPAGASDHGDHYYSKETDGAFALIEGWAEFASDYILGGTSFEATTYADGYDSDDYDGAIVEGACAEVLYDISDPGNDDGVPNKFNNLMSILPNYKPNQIGDVKSRWIQTGLPYQNELQQIYYKQKVDPPPMISVTVRALPSGRSFTVDGTTYASPQTFSWKSGSSHPISTTSPQSGAVGTQYVFGSWSDGQAISHTVAPTTGTTYTANFTTQYYLTMQTGTGGTVTPGSGWHDNGEMVPICATASTGYMFSSWSGGCYTGATACPTITMSSPCTQTANFTANPATIAVTFQTVPSSLQVLIDGFSYTTPRTFDWVTGQTHVITGTSPQSGGTGVQYVFASWSDGQPQTHTILVPSSAVTYTASFNTQYYLTMQAGAGGTVTPPSGWFNSGQVPICATASTGYTFSSWSGGCYTGATACPTITMSSPCTQTANFTANPATIAVTFQSSPSGRTVKVDGVNYTTPTPPFNWTAGLCHSIDADSPQSGSAGTQYVFGTWGHGGVKAQTVCPGSNTTYTANFTTQYYLTVQAGTGGTVTPSSGWLNSGQSVSLCASADTGYTFTSWSGACYAGATACPTITMSSPCTQTASFTATPGQISVTFRTAPAGLQVTVDGVPHATPYSVPWTPSSCHSIDTDSPQSGSTGTQYVWSSWDHGGTKAQTVCPGSNVTYTVNFTTQYYLTMQAGTGGTVTPPSGWHNSGDAVPICVSANSGYTFAGWSGGCYAGAMACLTITMSGPCTETASFTASASCVDCSDSLSKFEPCGNYPDYVNGGCNFTPSVFNLVECGEAFCGTVWADNGRRDTDWYLKTIDSASLVGWAAIGNFPVQVEIINITSGCGVGKSEGGVGATPKVSPFGVPSLKQLDPQWGSWINMQAASPDLSTYGTTNSAEKGLTAHGASSDFSCDTASQWAVLVPGTYAFFVSVYDSLEPFSGYPCSTGPWTYEASLYCYTYPPPANNRCEGCIELPDSVKDYWFTTLGATTDGPDAGPCFAGDTQIGSDVWYCWVAPYGGSWEANLCRSDYDTKLAVYDGDGCPFAVAPLVCNDDDSATCAGLQSRVTFEATSGSRYLLRIGGWNGQQGSGYLDINLFTDVKDAQPAVIPAAYTLSQNYPNPFNSGTEIRFTLPTAQWVTLSVYDLLGREIVRLVDQELSQGTMSVAWDGLDSEARPVPSGVYFYRLETKGYSETKKMVLLK